ATRCAERLATPPPPAPPVPAMPPLPAGPLSEHDAKRILKEAGIPVLEERLAACAGLGERLCLKIVSPEITHKTEVGGVMLDVPAEEAAGAFDALMARVRARAPAARLDGVLISPMLKGGVEMILGVQDDAVFGPVVMLGLGGIFVEV